MSGLQEQFGPDVSFVADFPGGGKGGWGICKEALPTQVVQGVTGKE